MIVILPLNDSIVNFRYSYPNLVSRSLCSMMISCDLLSLISSNAFLRFFLLSFRPLAMSCSSMYSLSVVSAYCFSLSCCLFRSSFCWCDDTLE